MRNYANEQVFAQMRKNARVCKCLRKSLAQVLAPVLERVIEQVLAQVLKYASVQDRKYARVRKYESA